MSDYKETAVVGSSFSRCRLIEISNPYQQAPSVVFTEERITNLDGRVLRDQPDAPIRADYDPTAIVAIYDPVTLLPTGATVTMQDIYGLMFSAYFHHATKRDYDLANTTLTISEASHATTDDSPIVTPEQ